MEKEELIKKWLDNDLNPEELKAFKSLKDYKSLTKLSHYSKEYKAPVFNKEKTFESISNDIKNNKRSSKSWLSPLLRIAAILAICLGSYYYTTTLDTTFTSELAEKTIIELPDFSAVNLNASSTITFNKNNWESNRDVKLEGEAFFKVKKGSTFNVLTSLGTVTVLGTEFNVKQRSNYFEVTCYEGLVEVTFKGDKMILKPGKSFLFLNGKEQKNNSTTTTKPDWLSNISTFKSTTLNQVLKEFERQYDVTVDASKIDTSIIVTGKFTHNDIEIALKSILDPLHLNYTKNNTNITLTLE